MCGDENTSRPRSLDSSPRALGSLSNYTRLVRTDMSPCERPLRPRGTAATTRPTPRAPAAFPVGGGAVRRHVRLRGFYWNGWSKGCGNASRGTTFEPGAGDSFYLTPSVAACRMCSRCMCPAYVLYPAEEPSDRVAKRVVLGTFQRLRNGKSCGIPGSGMILAIESYQRC